jgi:hypothetical protein
MDLSQKTMSLPSEPQSDQSTDTKVQLPANARVHPDGDAVAEQTTRELTRTN